MEAMVIAIFSSFFISLTLSHILTKKYHKVSKENDPLQYLMIYLFFFFHTYIICSVVLFIFFMIILGAV